MLGLRMNPVPDFDAVTATYIASLGEGHQAASLALLLKGMWERGRGSGLGEAYEALTRIEGETGRGTEEERLMRDCCREVWRLR